MRFVGAFKKFGKGLAKGALTTGKILAKVDDIPGASTAIAMIPIAGPILLAAAKRCDMVETILQGKPGAKKKEWVKAQLAKDLRKMGVEEKYIDELVSVGFLVKQGIITVVTTEDEKPKEEKKKGNGGRRKPAPEKPKEE